MSQTLSQAVGVRMAKELSYTARVFKGAEAARLGIANGSEADDDALEQRVAACVAQIAGNSRSAVAAMKDLYRLSQQGDGIERGLEKELDAEYAGITDTATRLAEFR